MAQIYRNESSILDSERINETISFLKRIFSRLKDSFKIIRSDDIESFELNGQNFRYVDEWNDQNSGYADELKDYNSRYVEEVETVKSLMQDISDQLEINPLFKDREFFDFLSISNISDYLLDDISLFRKHSSFFSGIIIRFKEILFHKIDCELNKDFSDYEDRYGEWESFYFKQKDYFYAEIYIYDGENSDLIESIVNILEGDSN